MSIKPVLLCILDGFGTSHLTKDKYNAIKQASTPFWDSLLEHYPNTEIDTSGEAVGLPEGQMGNSEVGHMTIGSGRIIFQDLLRINQAINNGSLEQIQVLQDLIKHHKLSNKTIHLFALCSDGGVHSHIDHLIFLVELLAKHHLKIKLHLFLDGRDTSPISAPLYLKQFDQNLIATISGRFYAMDRDKRLERTELAANAIIKGQGIKINNWQDYITSQYQQNISDEFIEPAILNDYQGIAEEDSILFVNFRSDRIIQLAKTILANAPNLAYKIGMTRYSEELNKQLNCLFPEQIINNNLGEVLSANGKKQLRVAETEKFAHVTFFFNGGKENLYKGEDRVLVPSPKVNTYDLKPEMAANEVTDKIIEALNNDKYDFILVNYANADMVGHCGKMKPAIEAVETIDKCLKKLYHAIKKVNGSLIITADHGNVELMFDEESNLPHTSHTLNPVPLVIVSDKLSKDIKLNHGNLSDIAPTILKLMDIKKPQEMTGKELI